MPTEEEREQYEKEIRKQLEAAYEGKHPRLTRILVGEGDSPAEAEEKVQQQMREMESAVERDYDQALRDTNPDSLIGKVVRGFPPMTGDQLMNRLGKARLDSTMRPLNATNDPTPADLPIGAEVRRRAEERTKLEPKLQFFASAHLPPHLAEISAQFEYLAHWIVENCPRNAERTIALNLLVQAKDAAVRTKVYKEPGK